MASSPTGTRRGRRAGSPADHASTRTTPSRRRSPWASCLAWRPGGPRARGLETRPEWHHSSARSSVPSLQGHPGLSDASAGTGVPESRGEGGVQDPQHHDGARDTRGRDDRMTGRRSHGRRSALNGVMHQGSDEPAGAHEVYIVYIMKRTQIYLTEEQGSLLEGRSKATGRTVSDLIRAAIDSVYSRRRVLSRAERVRVARRTVGSWRDFPESGAAYVDRVRGSRRLARLHAND